MLFIKKIVYFSVVYRIVFLVVHLNFFSVRPPPRQVLWLYIKKVCLDLITLLIYISILHLLLYKWLQTYFKFVKINIFGKHERNKKKKSTKEIQKRNGTLYSVKTICCTKMKKLVCKKKKEEEEQELFTF